MPDPTTYDDKKLFLRIAAGDEGAFEQLFETYGELLHPFISQTVKSTVVAQDIVQQVFLKVWLKRELLSEVENASAYLFKMASNESLMYLRSKASERKRYAEMEYQMAGGRDLSMESYINVEEIKQLVEEAFELLPPQQRRIYLLSRREQLNIPEIAERLDLSPLTVRNSLVRSLKIIREHLQKEGYLLPVALIGTFL